MSDLSSLVSQLGAAVKSNDLQTVTQLITAIKDGIENHQNNSQSNGQSIVIDTLQSLLTISDQSSNIRLIQALWRTITDLSTKNQSVNQLITQSVNGRSFIQNAVVLMLARMREATHEIVQLISLANDPSSQQSVVSEAGLRFKLARLPAIHAAALISKYPDQVCQSMKQVNSEQSNQTPVSPALEFIGLVQSVLTAAYGVHQIIDYSNSHQPQLSVRMTLLGHCDSLLLSLIGNVINQANQSTIESIYQSIYQSATTATTSTRKSDSAVDGQSNASIASTVCVLALILPFIHQSISQPINQLIELFDRCSVVECTTLSNSQSDNLSTNVNPSQCLSLTVACAVYQSIKLSIKQSVIQSSDSMLDDTPPPSQVSNSSSQSTKQTTIQSVNQISWRYIGHINPRVRNIFRLIFVQSTIEFGTFNQSTNLSIAHHMLAKSNKQPANQLINLSISYRDQVVVDILALILPLFDKNIQNQAINQTINQSVIDRLKAQLEQRPYIPVIQSDEKSDNQSFNQSLNQSQPTPMNDGGVVDESLPSSAPLVTQFTQFDQSVNQISLPVSVSLLSQLPLELLDPSLTQLIFQSVLLPTIALFSNCVTAITQINVQSHNQPINQSLDQSWLFCFYWTTRLLIVCLRDRALFDRAVNQSNNQANNQSFFTAQLRSSMTRLFSNKTEQPVNQSNQQSSNQTNQSMGRLNILINLIESIDQSEAHLVTTSLIELIHCLSINHTVHQTIDQATNPSLNQSILQPVLLIKSLTGVALLCAKVQSAAVQLPQLIDRLIDRVPEQSNHPPISQALINTLIVLCHSFASPSNTQNDNPSHSQHDNQPSTTLSHLITIVNIEPIASISSKLDSIKQSVDLSMDAMLPADQLQRINQSIVKYNESVNQSIGQFIERWSQQDVRFVDQENQIFHTFQLNSRLQKQSNNQSMDPPINQAINQTVNSPDVQVVNQSINQLLASLRHDREILFSRLRDHSINSYLDQTTKTIIDEEQKAWRDMELG